VQVGDAVLALEGSGALEFDVPGREVVEEPAPLAEEHRDEVNLELIEDAAARASCAVPAPWTSTSWSPAASFACVMTAVTSSTYATSGICANGVAGSWRLRMKMGTPSWWSPRQPRRRLERSSAGDDRPGGHEFVHDLAVDAAGGQ
jgi:hypothetical protein